ncbi:MAG: 1-acyl-sn-glycerol-3-phosphate acyltransferase [Bifidobacteriaceae bacterium]|jgi:1-acyl-sn-glycerol-3-phosphate acyltransferase|nr:1-acyl-sn-glycerol-3-phosphate acyltransferase [Bifidobacteriaceae bacterium]
MAKKRVPFAYKVVIAILAPLAYVLTKRQWRGRENFPGDGGFIVAANHISSMDFLPLVHMLAWWVRPPQVLAKESLFRVPVVGAAMRGMGMIPVYRGTAKAGWALKDAAKALEEGGLVLIYPEGTVTRDPDTWPMRGRPGAVRLALETGRPLVPVAQWGAQRMLPKGHKCPRVFPRTRVKMLVGKPLDLSDLRDSPNREAAVKQGTERLMVTLGQMVGELRGLQPPDQPYNQFTKRKDQP